MNEYINEINQMKWSFSRLSSFEHCKYEFYLKYIVNDENKYFPEGNYFADLGTYVHDILAKIFEQKLSLEDAPAYFVNNYDNNVFYKTKKSTMNRSFELCADYFSCVDFDWLKDYEILGVEKEIKGEIQNYKFVGYIDLLIRSKHTGEIIIIDHKSAAYPLKQNGGVLKKSEHSFYLYKMQMYLYSYMVEKIYGEFPKFICWNHFKEGKYVTIPFDMNEYNDTIDWFINTISQIKEEELFEPSINQFYCKTLCAFRNSCEYI